MENAFKNLNLRIESCGLRMANQDLRIPACLTIKIHIVGHSLSQIEMF